MTGTLFAGVIAALSLAGCSNSKLRQTPSVVKGTPWFCELNEARDDWVCVRDAEQARHPVPSRLPGDPPEPSAATGASTDLQADPIEAASGTSAPPANDAAVIAGSASTSPAEPREHGNIEPTAPPAADSEGSAAIPGDNDANAAVTDARDPTERLLALPGDSYAVQLIAFNDADEARAFIAERGLGDALQLRIARDDAIYHVVLLGVYDTYADATAAVDAQRGALAGIEPWIRSLASVQEGLKAASVRIAGGQ